MKFNFMNRAGRTYYVLNPDQFGNGRDLAYYRESLLGRFHVKLLMPGTGAEVCFDTAEEAQAWIKSEVEQRKYYF